MAELGNSAIKEHLYALESALEKLVDRCNNDLGLSSEDVVITAEAALERLYRAREEAAKNYKGEER